jgi:hypothetical protein
VSRPSTIGRRVVNRAQRVDHWFGKIWVEPEVVALMAKEYDDQKVAAAGMTKQELIEQSGSPMLKIWFDKHYDGKVFREVRKQGGVTDKPIVSEYSMMDADAPHEISRVRLITWPKKSTNVSVIRPDEPRSVM